MINEKYDPTDIALMAGIAKALGGGGGGGASALTDLSDVAISSAQNGQALKYNSSTSKWENSNDVGAVIDDSDVSATKAWSSYKINAEIQGALILDVTNIGV